MSIPACARKLTECTPVTLAPETAALSPHASGCDSSVALNGVVPRDRPWIASAVSSPRSRVASVAIRMPTAGAPRPAPPAPAAPTPAPGPAAGDYDDADLEAAFAYVDLLIRGDPFSTGPAPPRFNELCASSSEFAARVKAHADDSRRRASDDEDPLGDLG